MKQVFQQVPRGSYNTMVYDGWLGKKMRKHCLLALLLVTLIVSSGAMGASAEVTVSPQYVKPGNSIDLIFTGAAGSYINVTVSNSRITLEEVVLELGETGQYMWRYTVNETAYTDSYTVSAIIEGVTMETGFIVSNLEPAQLANTMRTMAENSKRQAQTAMIEARRSGNLNTDMVTAHKNGIDALENSRQYAEQGEHTKAFEEIKTALNHFEMILNDYYAERNPPEKTEEDTETIRIQEAIKALNSELVKLNETAGTLERKGFNVDALEKGLVVISAGIQVAEEKLEAGDIESALDSLNKASTSNKRIQDALRNRLEELNQNKVQQYQTSLVNRYNTMQNTLNVLQTVNSDKVSGVLSDLTGLQTKLDQARTLYMQGNHRESVRVLQSADAQFKEAFNALNGANNRQLLNTLDRLSLKLEGPLRPRERERIEAEINAIETSLRNRLQVNSTSNIKPSVRQTPQTNAPTLTP